MFVALSVWRKVLNDPEKKKHNLTYKKQAAYLIVPVLQVLDFCAAASCD